MKQLGWLLFLFPDQEKFEVGLKVEVPHCCQKREGVSRLESSRSEVRGEFSRDDEKQGKRPESQNFATELIEL